MGGITPLAMKVGILLSRVRLDEKMLFEALDKRHQPFDRVDDRETVFNFDPERWRYDLVLIRSISQSRAIYGAGVLKSLGVRTVNSYDLIARCADKLLTTSLLMAANIPCPKTSVAFSPEAALEAIEKMGYPVVLKPITGSWGRLLARVNDRDAAEALLEHKEVLGSYQHSIYYMQEHIPKPGRDIRVVVIGDEPVAAMYRYSSHWVTNSARGARSVNCPITPELGTLALAAARVMGDGAVAVDILESPRGLLVNEVNGTMEFKSCAQATGVDIAGCLVDYALKVADG